MARQGGLGRCGTPKPSSPQCGRRVPQRLIRDASVGSRSARRVRGDAAAASKWRRKQWRLRRIVAVGALNDPSVLVLLFAYRTDSL